MKRLTLITMLLATAMVARAFDFSEAAPTGQTLYYTITSGSTVKVVSGTPKPTGRLVIPATAQGYSVTEIDRMAFSNCTGLTSVSIPGSVTTIGMRAFAGCSSLTSAFLAEGVQSLAMMVFSSCTALDTVSLPTTITQLAAGCFGNTAYMTNGSHWQDSVLYVGRYLVAAQSSRTAPLIVADSTLGIANDALEYCHISKCVLPAGLHFIGDLAFKDCQFLDTVRLLGATPPSVGGDSFQGTSAGLAIAVPCNSATAYSAAQHWSQLNIVEDSCPSPQVTYDFSALSPSGHTLYYKVSDSCEVTVTYPGSNIYYPYSGYVEPSGALILPSDVMYNGIIYTVTSIGDNAFSGCSGLTEITSLALTAPSQGNNAFNGVSRTIPIYIPCGSLTSYQISWDYFSNFLELPFPFIINVGVTSPTYGVSYITHGPTCDYMAIIEAVANYGYHFTQWNDGDTNNPRTITLTQDTSFTASFAPNQYTLTITAGEHGTANGSGTYNYGDTITIQAYPEAHYHFTHWNDGNTDNPRQYRVEVDNTLRAFFSIDIHTVTVTSNDITRGMVEASGIHFVYGTPCTITAIPYSGYQFVRWSNGETYNPYTFAVLEDVELIAIFASEDSIGIDDVVYQNAMVYYYNGQIVIEGADGNDVTLYDITGRVLATRRDEFQTIKFDIPGIGVYLVKLGTTPARKVVVMD